MNRRLHLGIAFVAGVTSVLGCQYLIDNHVEQSIKDNAWMEEHLYLSITKLMGRAVCHNAKVLDSVVVMECSIENEKLTHADLAADEKVVEVVQKYFRHSETKIPTMYKVEDGRLTTSFNQIMNEAYTYTVENDANTWKITCIKPLSSGQVCPK